MAISKEHNVNTNFYVIFLFSSLQQTWGRSMRALNSIFTLICYKNVRYREQQFI